MRSILFFFAFVALSTKLLRAATITAASVAFLDVSNAVQSAAQGDTVSVPAGSAIWTNAWNISFKNINLVGAGLDQTVITRSTASDSTIIMQFILNKTNFVTLRGFTFINSNRSSFGQVAFSSSGFGGGNQICQFHCTQCKFTFGTPTTSSGSRGLYIGGTWGLIDNCYFYQPTANGGQGITITTDNYNGTTNTWHTPQYLGDTNCLCIENCKFDFGGYNDGAFDMYVGQKVTFRYNSVTNTGLGWHGYDSSVRSAKSAEVYQNSFYTNSSIRPDAFILSRGGTHVAWSNTIASTYQNFCLFKYYRADTNCLNSGTCPSIIYGTNTVDGNFDSYGYPGLDQPGRGSFPIGTTWISGASSYATNDYEVAAPIYQWGNTWGTNNAPTSSVQEILTSTTNSSVNAANLIKVNRDYFDNTILPGYVPLVFPHPLADVTVRPSMSGTATLSGRSTLQ